MRHKTETEERGTAGGRKGQREEEREGREEKSFSWSLSYLMDKKRVIKKFAKPEPGRWHSQKLTCHVDLCV